MGLQRPGHGTVRPVRAPVTGRGPAAVHDMVLQRQDEVLDLIQLESGKARTHAFEEVAHGHRSRWYARRGPAMLEDERHPESCRG